MEGKRVVGVGAALVDLLLEESDEFIHLSGQPKGGMTFSELHHIEEMLKKSIAQHKISPGGSACNTIVGFCKLGGEGSFIGMCGNDDFGQLFENSISGAGVKSLLKKSAVPTGRVLSVITPDAQRTMFTHLGASADFQSHVLDKMDFHDAGLVYLEGYLLFNEPLVRELVKHAREANAKVALDLASFQVVEACKPLMKELLDLHVDIVLANEDEAKAFTGHDAEDSLKFFADAAEIAVVKLGEKGAVMQKGHEKCRVQALPVKAVDTTGAGDLWASGFIYGLVKGLGLERAGSLGAAVASEVVSQIGAHMPEETWQRLKQKHLSDK